MGAKNTIGLTVAFAEEAANLRKALKELYAASSKEGKENMLKVVARSSRFFAGFPYPCIPVQP